MFETPVPEKYFKFMAPHPQLGFATKTLDILDLSSVVRAAAPWLSKERDHRLSSAERELLESVNDQAHPAGVRTNGPATRPQQETFTSKLADARSIEERRNLGQFFTPQPIVDVMIEWVREQTPAQIVDAGCGTGRFAVAAARAMPDIPVLAIDSDPVATLVCRARVSELGLDKITVHCGDFLREPLPLPLPGSRTAYVGNPPYVRHHRLSPELKSWAAQVCRELGVKFSKLAGLHAYFFLATALHARPGDIGCYITSAEWLDVNYGACMRQLLGDQLGLLSVSVLEDSRTAFNDAMTSAAITCFQVGQKPSTVSFSKVEEFTDAGGAPEALQISVDRLDGRWSPLLRTDLDSPKDGLARLGDLVSVHRGVATGANKFFVMPPGEAEILGLARFAKPVVSASRQILGCCGVLSSRSLDRIILLPRELDGLPAIDREAVDRFLADGKVAGVTERYLCRHRNPWWWLGPLRSAPIIASYMARRPPAFALNPDGALLLNIAHGLFPRFLMTTEQMRLLVNSLNGAAPSFAGSGRTYKGGLEKFEPREMENLMVPAPKELRDLAAAIKTPQL